MLFRFEILSSELFLFNVGAISYSSCLAAMQWTILTDPSDTHALDLILQICTESLIIMQTVTVFSLAKTNAFSFF